MSQTATVSPAELRIRPDLGTKVRLLDVRTPGEYTGARIPGSYNVPLPDLASYVGAIVAGPAAWQSAGGDVETDTPIWALERQVRLVAGSIVAASILASLKFPKARFLAGGVGSGLVFAAVSNTCLMGNLLAKLPYNRAEGGDVAASVAALTA